MWLITELGLSHRKDAGMHKASDWLSLSLPAVPLQLLGFISTVEELPFEELDRNDSKYEHEEHVDDQDIQDILQGVHHTVEHSLHGKENRAMQEWTRTGAATVEPRGKEMGWSRKGDRGIKTEQDSDWLRASGTRRPRLPKAFKNPLGLSI